MGPGTVLLLKQKQRWVTLDGYHQINMPLKMLLKGSCCAIRRVNFTDSAKDLRSWQPKRMKDPRSDRTKTTYHIPLQNNAGQSPGVRRDYLT
jgi:hypothetical protein